MLLIGIALIVYGCVLSARRRRGYRFTIVYGPVRGKPAHQQRRPQDPT